MSILVSFLDDNQGLEFLVSGIVYGADIIKAHNEFHTKEINALLKYKVIDKSKVTENHISTAEIEIIANLDNELIRNYPKIAILVVVSRYEDITTTQQWTAFSEIISNNLHFFTSRQEANEWIKSNVNCDD